MYPSRPVDRSKKKDLGGRTNHVVTKVGEVLSFHLRYSSKISKISLIHESDDAGPDTRSHIALMHDN